MKTKKVINLLFKGCKLRLPHWYESHYVHLVNNKIYDEKGVEVVLPLLWLIYRRENIEIYEEKKPTPKTPKKLTRDEAYLAMINDGAKVQWYGCDIDDGEYCYFDRDARSFKYFGGGHDQKLYSYMDKSNEFKIYEGEK